MTTKLSPFPAIKILIVEDSRIICHRLALMMSDVPDVEIVGMTASIVETRILLQNNIPDVVILDLHLVDGNGLDLIREMKALPNPPLIAVLTNYPEYLYRRRSKEFGADFFLDKSTEFERVIEIVESIRPNASTEKSE